MTDSLIIEIDGRKVQLQWKVQLGTAGWFYKDQFMSGNKEEAIEEATFWCRFWEQM